MAKGNPTKPGDRFGRLVVLSDKGSGRGTVLCRCDCGAERSFWRANLRSGCSESCGCLHRQRVVECNTTHGDAVKGRIDPCYVAWAQMIQRCTNPRTKQWDGYGGRGITVCERWRDSYEAFLADMGRKPSEAHSLDRIDNNLGYQPSNCRWATRVQQARNRNNNHRVAFGGKTLCLSEWAERTGIHYSALVFRFIRGWPVERALTQPMRKSPRR